MPRKKRGRIGVTLSNDEHLQRAFEAHDNGVGPGGRHQAAGGTSSRVPPLTSEIGDQPGYAEQPLAPAGATGVDRWLSLSTRIVQRVFPLTLNMNSPGDPVALQTLMDSRPYLADDEDLGDRMAKMFPAAEKRTEQIFKRLQDQPPGYQETRTCSRAVWAEWVQACRAAA